MRIQLLAVIVDERKGETAAFEKCEEGTWTLKAKSRSLLEAGSPPLAPELVYAAIEPCLTSLKEGILKALADRNIPCAKAA